jgi:UPF0271 protein
MSHPETEPRRQRIDLNADLGEGFPNDRALLQRVSSTSVCCGAHAADPATIRETLLAAQEEMVVVGAHPGYPDRENFGRREQLISITEVERLILDQVSTLSQLANRLGMRIRFLKPHGALYNQAQREEGVATAVVQSARLLDLPVLGLPGGLVEQKATSAGVRFVAEGFPDRRYRDDGTLVPRSEPGAVLHELDDIAAQVARLLASGIETLCIHGDEPAAIANADRIHLVLERLGVGMSPFLDSGSEVLPG